MNVEARGVSKSQLDKLGSRLRNSVDPDDDDLVLLGRYRERFIAVNDAIVDDLQKLTDVAIESRHKSVPSIVAKLRRRQPARLSAIQDIAGARIIVWDLRAQDKLVEKLIARYPNAVIDDKRLHPTFNYRAVHVVTGTPLQYEIQVRTLNQQTWAQLSERLADSRGSSRRLWRQGRKRRSHRQDSGARRTPPSCHGSVENTMIDIVVVYDRSAATVVELKSYSGDLRSAFTKRLELERAYRTRGRSPQTIRNTMSMLLKAFGVDNRAALISECRRRSLFEPSSPAKP